MEGPIPPTLSKEWGRPGLVPSDIHVQLSCYSGIICSYSRIDSFLSRNTSISSVSIETMVSG